MALVNILDKVSHILHSLTKKRARGFEYIYIHFRMAVPITNKFSHTTVY